jgi:ribonuclease T2
VLALSWSPTFCASAEAEDEAAQCRRGPAFGFIVHGLWPQYRTSRPQFCPHPDRWVPERMISSMLPLMPSKRLVIHQWRKHGTCSGLAMDDYFGLMKRLFANLSIPARYRSPPAAVAASPDEIRSDFIAANPGLEPSMIAIACRRGNRRATLSEVRICFSPAGEFAQCSPRRRTDCQAETLVLPPIAAKPKTIE